MNAARGATLTASLFGMAIALLGGIVASGIGSVVSFERERAQTPRAVVAPVIPGETLRVRTLRRAHQSLR